MFRIDRAELVRLTADLVRMPTINPPGREGLAAPYLRECMRAMDLAVTVQEVLPGRPNVIGRWGQNGGKAALLINGHYDVVPPGHGWTLDPYSGLVRHGLLYGRGAFDMKGGIAAALVAVPALQAAGVTPARDVLLNWVVDEEFHQQGTQAAVQAGYIADQALVAEGTNAQLIAGCRGALLYEVELEGLAAHSSTPEAGRSAIRAAASIVQAVDAYVTGISDRRWPRVNPPSLNVGKIEGGHSEWAVPGRCVLIMDRRYLPGEDPDAVEVEIGAMVERALRAHPGVRHRMRRLAHSPADPSGPESPIGQLTLQAAREAFGQEPQVGGLNGAGDCAFLAAAGMPVVNFGPAGGGAHGPDEYVEIDSLEKCAHTYAQVIARCAGAPP